MPDVDALGLERSVRLLSKDTKTLSSSGRRNLLTRLPARQIQLISPNGSHTLREF